MRNLLINIKDQISYLLFYQRTKFNNLKTLLNTDPDLDFARIFEDDYEDKFSDHIGIDSNSKSVSSTDPDLDIARRFADDVAADDDDDEGINGISNDNVGVKNNHESDEFSPASRQLWEFAMIEGISGKILINTCVAHEDGLDHGRA